MVRRLRSFILIAIAAIAGAVCGRIFARMRAAQQDPSAVVEHDPGIRLRPQDFVPGLVAAFRVSEPPWSWLHVPGWLAAFSVNFAAAALAGDFSRLRELFEAGGLSFDKPWADRSAVSEWTIEEEPLTTAHV